jgi:hypothetical protein
MNPAVNSTRHEAIEHHEPSLHYWRASQLRRLGMPAALAEVYADHHNWHQLARLVSGGCPPRLALRIAC